MPHLYAQAFERLRGERWIKLETFRILADQGFSILWYFDRAPPPPHQEEVVFDMVLSDLRPDAKMPYMAIIGYREEDCSNEMGFPCATKEEAFNVAYNHKPPSTFKKKG